MTDNQREKNRGTSESCLRTNTRWISVDLAYMAWTKLGGGRRCKLTSGFRTDPVNETCKYYSVLNMKILIPERPPTPSSAFQQRNSHPAYQRPDSTCWGQPHLPGGDFWQAAGLETTNRKSWSQSQGATCPHEEVCRHDMGSRYCDSQETVYW